ncbi:hypothetical protein HN011_003380, partial [Eciton burchellii]
NGRRIYFHILSNTVRQRLHETDTLFIGAGHIIYRQRNHFRSLASTVTSSINLAGLRWMNAIVELSIVMHTWDKVVVQATVKTLRITRSRSNAQHCN